MLPSAWRCSPQWPSTMAMTVKSPHGAQRRRPRQLQASLPAEARAAERILPYSPPRQLPPRWLLAPGSAEPSSLLLWPQSRQIGRHLPVHAGEQTPASISQTHTWRSSRRALLVSQPLDPPTWLADCTHLGPTSPVQLRLRSKVKHGRAHGSTPDPPPSCVGRTLFSSKPPDT